MTARESGRDTFQAEGIGQTLLSSHGPLILDGGQTLVEQLVAWVKYRIDERLYRPGTRLPSIRTLASDRGISRFTVVEAYERLVALGYLESRRGSGFFVRERAPALAANDGLAKSGRQALAAPARLDVKWLLNNMFRQLPAAQMPGSGLPPPDWLDGELIASHLRAVGRQNGAAFLGYGVPHGFLPLRNQLQLKLAECEIAVEPGQIVLTAGATHAFEIIARHFLSPGDTVLVDDPAWFLMFGLFAAHGARVLGVPRLADGPDIAELERLAQEHKPRLFVVNSVLHNPTSTSLSAAKAFQILKLAEQHDFVIIEDDVYGDLHPGSVGGRAQAATRMASLDQLKRVLYLGSFSKTLAANLRVGFIAAAPDVAETLADHKMLGALTTPEIGERVIYRILTEGHYRKHVDRLRARLDTVRDRTIRQLERTGLVPATQPAVGMFVWMRAEGVDTNAVAARMMERGYLLAPGSLFSPSQLPSPLMRFNIATSSDSGMLAALAETLDTYA